MKHLRQRTKTQRANAAILSILTVLSPLQVFGSVLAPIDLGEYFFEVYATAQKPAFSGPVERALKKELEDFVGSGDYNFFSKKTEITWNVWAEGNITGNSVHSKDKDLTKQLGGQAFACRCDITSEQELSALADFAVSKLGKVDILVNNAGGGGPKPFDMPMADFRRAYELNVFSFSICHNLLRQKWKKMAWRYLTITLWRQK